MRLLDKVAHTANSLLAALKMPEAAHQANQVLGDMRFPQLSSLLPYRDYDEHSGLFINDGSVGFMLEVQPLTGASPDEVMAIEGLLRTKLPRGVPLSIHLMSSQCVGAWWSRGCVTSPGPGLMRTNSMQLRAPITCRRRRTGFRCRPVWISR